MKTFLTILLTALIIAAGVGGGVYYYFNSQATTDKQNLQDQIDALKKRLSSGTTSTSGTATTSGATATTGDVTKDWKTYVHDTSDPTFIGFQIKYPREWTPKSVSDYTIFYDENNQEPFSIEQAVSNSEDIDSRTYLSGKESLKDYPKEKVANYTGYYSVNESVDKYSKTIVVQNPNRKAENVIFHLSAANKEEFQGKKAIFNQIISTFRFTK